MERRFILAGGLFRSTIIFYFNSIQIKIYLNHILINQIDEMVGTTNKTMVYSSKKEKWHQQTDKLIDKKLQIQSIKLLS